MRQIPSWPTRSALHSRASDAQKHLKESELRVTTSIAAEAEAAVAFMVGQYPARMRAR